MDRLRTIICGSLVVGSLIVSTGPTLARDDFRRTPRDRDRRDYYERDLERNRRQLDEDIRNRADPRKIERDKRAIQTDLDNLRRDRYTRRDRWVFFDRD